MKKNLIKIGVGSLVIIGGIFLGRYIFNKIKLKKELLKDVDETVTSPLGEVKPFLLKVGSGMGSLSSQSKDVMKMQKILNRLAPTPYAKLDVDGKFGAKTLDLLNAVVIELKISNSDIKTVNSILLNTLIKSIKDNDSDNVEKFMVWR